MQCIYTTRGNGWPAPRAGLRRHAGPAEHSGTPCVGCAGGGSGVAGGLAPEAAAADGRIGEPDGAAPQTVAGPHDDLRRAAAGERGGQGGG